jgi:Chalcone isomerase-like
MSLSTRLSIRSFFLAALIAVAASAADIGSPGLPPAVAAQLPEVRIRGGGELTFLGLSIYDARLYRDAAARGDCAPDEAFALQLTYKRRLYGERIAARSVEEMTKLGFGTAEQRAHWGELLKKILPDVDAGDFLTGVNVPRRGVHFYQNGKPIGAIDDREFAQAFFGIWLDPRTSEPALRKQLLGEGR